MPPPKRAPDQMRAVSLTPGFARHAEGSCLVKFGDTHVLVTHVSLQEWRAAARKRLADPRHRHVEGGGRDAGGYGERAEGDEYRRTTTGRDLDGTLAGLRQGGEK